jgi:SAM-dependent methyltransferase
MGLLAREGPSPAAGPVADLGAGIGWVSFRLAQLRYRVVAIEASIDRDFGLGAAERYFLPEVTFVLSQGNLEHPPLQVGAMGLIIFNASLHYADDLEATLRRASLALRPGGRLIVLDTPIVRRPRSGTGQGDRHLGRHELDAALLAAGLSTRWVPIRRGLSWWWHRIKALLKRDPLRESLVGSGLCAVARRRRLPACGAGLAAADPQSHLQTNLETGHLLTPCV